MPTVPQFDPIALRPRQAARVLGIGERTLWRLSSPRGPIPCVRVGRIVLYTMESLADWLARQATERRAATETEGAQ